MVRDTFPIVDQEYRDMLIIATQKYVRCKFFNCIVSRQEGGSFEECHFEQCAVYVDGMPNLE